MILQELSGNFKEVLDDRSHKEQHRRNQLYAKYYDTLPTINHSILYEAREGQSMTDSPLAIFKYILEHDTEKTYQHIWAIQPSEELEKAIAPYREKSNVTFVDRTSDDYLKWLVQAHYLLNNSTFQSFFVPRPEQTYINTWHGTPLKYMGYDIPGNPSGSQNVVRNFLSADYIISPNAHTTDIFSNAFRLDGIYEGSILEMGYPRNDLTFHSKREDIIEKLHQQGLAVSSDQKIVLYSPTWKGTDTNNANDHMKQIIKEMDDLAQQIGPSYHVLLKVHPFLYHVATNYPEAKSRLVSDLMDMNELLSVVDVLITDYSSVFFDYLVTDKPILFYSWDKDLYAQNRGMYLEEKELPGPILEHIDEVGNAILHIEDVKSKYKDVYQAAKKRFVHYDDGKVTERLYHLVFCKETLNDVKIVRYENKKKKIFIYPGGLINNGITNSFINLTNNIDYDKYDVTAFVAASRREEVLYNQNRIHKKVRFLFKPGVPVYTFKEAFLDRLIRSHGLTPKLKPHYPTKAYEREIRRLTGGVHFDYAIDFSGYSYYWSKLILAANSTRKICFLHSDMQADRNRKVNGKKPHYQNLLTMFSIYYKFDKLLAVSEATMELNQSKLTRFTNDEQFGYCINTIDPDRILNPPKTGMTQNKEETHITLMDEIDKWQTSSETVSIYRTLAEIKEESPTMQHSVQADDEIHIFAQYHWQDENYCKIAINDIYVGWCKESLLEIEIVDSYEDETIQYQDLKMFGKLTNVSSNYYVWNLPFGAPGAHKKSDVTSFKDLMVYISKVVKTQQDTYYLISINRHELGWINSNSVTLIDKIGFIEKSNPLFRIIASAYLKMHYFNHKDMIGYVNRLATLEENVKQYGYILEDIDGYKLFTKPPTNPESEIVKHKKDLRGKLIFVHKKQIIEDHVYYYIKKNSYIEGWIDSRYIRLVPPDYSVFIDEKEISYPATVEGDSIEVYKELPTTAEVADFILHDDLHLKPLLVKKEMRTGHGRSLLLYDGDKKIGWVDKKVVTPYKCWNDIHNNVITLDDDSFKFVTMGRLSPEKAQDKLIKAFAQIHEEYPNTKLYLVGDGQLRKSLNSLVKKLNLKDSVFLTGQLDNPFSFMKQCDAFVLSSIYEGQPMVLLEALTLKMKIVATNIVANRAALANGDYGLLTEDTSVESIYDAMKKIYLEPDLSFKEFDYLSYNQHAIENFYREIND
ncbi:glycosyltransferase [Rummeliibacillus sp. TYF005]|uniref:CDP-glycerol glycerophosphotransferase family protein n=1 Tax=unclassified Rummeliibacillus TaxID=2622809 RepID=UPI000E667B42|nr:MULTISPECIES: CDP-glycerol glycerophosphotransferase family protein [unclassified Rummeliibacillus]RIJ69542.1 glycosyltransferase [Rummeliibacillus sp. POC4]RPJ96509.1 glycosyltransferase [Rummeliibacillus sp. TYF005]